MKLLTEVLNEKRSISSDIFLMVLCKVFNSPLVGASASPPAPLPRRGELSASITCIASFHNFFKKPETPVIPLVFQGLLCSSGPKNISYKRRQSAPNFSQM